MSTTEPKDPTETAAVTHEVAPGSGVPPAGEDIHLPPGSILPFLTAVGVTMLIVGLTVGRVWLILGAIISIVCIVRWIRDTVRDIDHLPEDHGTGH